MGTDCLVELRCMVAYALDERAARPIGILVGIGRLIGDYFCFLGRQYVFVRTALVWGIVIDGDLT